MLVVGARSPSEREETERFDDEQVCDQDDDDKSNECVPSSWPCFVTLSLTHSLWLWSATNPRLSLLASAAPSLGAVARPTTPPPTAAISSSVSITTATTAAAAAALSYL